MAEMSPDITFFQILARLPVKSLRRFQCVSKQWHSFLTTPEFTNMRLHHQNHYNLLVFTSTHPYKFRIIECENPKQNSLTTNSRPLPFELRYLRRKSILTSFHGMVCVGIVNTAWLDRYSDLILWNPWTGDYKTLSKAGSHKQCYDIYGGLFQLYYTSFDDEYKLLRVTRKDSNVYIYSLKSDSWRKAESTEPFRPIHDPRSSVLFNGNFYFLEKIDIGNYSIIRFDTKTEKFTRIATPFSTTDRLMIRFMVLKGCIHVLYVTILLSRDKRCDELWRMDEDGGWTKVETISGFSLNQQPLHLMRNGNWLVRSEYGNVYQVNLKKRNRRRSCSIRSSEIVIEERYMETLVSPNQYMIK